MTNDQRPQEIQPAVPRRRWLPSYQMLRLGILMAALTLGLTGMLQHDDRMILAAFIFAIIGVILRFAKPKNKEGA
ncbi:MAG: hypothetical protein ABIQ41_11555 [Gemmatimonadales bacterium]